VTATIIRFPDKHAADTAASTPQPFSEAMMFSTMRSDNARSFTFYVASTHPLHFSSAF
jgi:hypothetical protein